jgi:ATP-binding cassette, subfamily B (MDR/TAP), member 1
MPESKAADAAVDESAADKKAKAAKKNQIQASVSETLSFVFDCGVNTTILFIVGFIAGIGNGSVYPMLAYLFSNSFADISGATTNGLDPIRELAYMFLVVGTFALVMATIQTTAFEIVAYRASQNLRLTWFRSLLRQDPAFFDVHDIGGIANNVGPASNAYRRGTGRKFGEGIQFSTIGTFSRLDNERSSALFFGNMCSSLFFFFCVVVVNRSLHQTTGIGGLGYAMFSSWRVALLVLGVTPLLSISAMAVVSLNQTKSSRAAKSYSTAGSVAYSTVSSVRTVLSLNAIERMIEKYSEATQEAFKNSTAVLIKQGFANGTFVKGLRVRCVELFRVHHNSHDTHSSFHIYLLIHVYYRFHVGLVHFLVRCFDALRIFSSLQGNRRYRL